MSSGCCDIELEGNTKIGGAIDPDYAQIEVVVVPEGGNHRSKLTLGNSGNSSSLTGSWDTDDTDGSVAAHEAGYAMGIDDEYEDNAEGYSEATGDAIGEGSGAGAQPSIMAQTWDDDEGDAPSSKVRHVDSIMNAHDVECPDECLLNWTERQPAPTLVPPITPTPTPTPTPPPPPTETPTPTPTATPEPTVSAVVTVTVLFYDGRQFPLDQFNLAGSDACEFSHYHPKGGSAYSLDITLYMDPDQPECGFGPEGEIPTGSVTVAKAVYDAYLEAVQ